MFEDQKQHEGNEENEAFNGKEVRTGARDGCGGMTVLDVQAKGLVYTSPVATPRVARSKT